MLLTILTNPLFQSIVAGQIRHLVTVAGTAAVTQGVIQGSDAEKVAGALAVVLAAVWSAIQKKLAA